MSALRARRSAALLLGLAVLAGSWSPSTARTAAQASAAGEAGPATVGTSVPAEDPRVPIADPVLIPIELPGATPNDLAPASSPTSGATGPSVPSAAPSPPAPPTSGVPTPESASPSASDARRVPEEAPGAPLDPAAVDAVLAPLLAGGALGAGPSPARVVDVATGEVLYDAADVPTVPASTMKLVTAAAVLEVLGVDAVLRTRAVLVNPDAAAPRVVLVGAGDPSLASSAQEVGGSGSSLQPASLQVLARETARSLALQGITRVRVGFDDSLFTGPALHPSWDRSLPGVGIVAPVSALQVDQGRRIPDGLARVSDPAARAGEVFAEQLAAAGLVVRGRPSRRELAGAGSTVAAVESPALGVLVERMLSTSDNDYAEALGRLAAAGSAEPASFVGVGRTAASVLANLGVDASGGEFADASGLSRSNRLSPELLTDLLVEPVSEFGPLHSGLPVAGATGSLRTRFEAADQRAAAGLVRAKTGTLTEVTSLAGYLSRPDGRLLAFGFVDGSTPAGAFAARAAMDRALAALVECDCAAGPDPSTSTP